jgi:uncharacterized membrane protein
VGIITINPDCSYRGLEPVFFRFSFWALMVSFFCVVAGWLLCFWLGLLAPLWLARHVFDVESARMTELGVDQSSCSIPRSWSNVARLL